MGKTILKICHGIIGTVHHKILRKKMDPDILKQMELKETEELTKILNSNDKNMYKSDILEAIRLILWKRGIIDLTDEVDEDKVEPDEVDENVNKKKKLYRNEKKGKATGLCYGLGKYLGVDPSIFRFIVVVTSFIAGIGFIVYILLSLIIPEENKFSKLKQESNAKKTEPVEDKENKSFELKQKIEENSKSKTDNEIKAQGKRGKFSIYKLSKYFVPAIIIIFLLFIMINDISGVQGKYVATAAGTNFSIVYEIKKDKTFILRSPVIYKTGTWEKNGENSILLRFKDGETERITINKRDAFFYHNGIRYQSY